MSFEDEYERRLQDVFKTSSRRLHQNECLLGINILIKIHLNSVNFTFIRIAMCVIHILLYSIFLPFFPLLTSCTYLEVYYFAVVMSSEEGLFVKKRKKEKKTSSENQLSFIISIRFQLVEDMFTYITIQKLSSGNVLLKSVLKNFVKSSQEITFVRIFFSIELLAPGLQLY